MTGKSNFQGFTRSHPKNDFLFCRRLTQTDADIMLFCPATCRTKPGHPAAAGVRSYVAGGKHTRAELLQVAVHMLAPSRWDESPFGKGHDKVVTGHACPVKRRSLFNWGRPVTCLRLSAVKNFSVVVCGYVPKKRGLRKGPFC
jgi:hypothetical protein